MPGLSITSIAGFHRYQTLLDEYSGNVSTGTAAFGGIQQLMNKTKTLKPPTYVKIENHIPPYGESSLINLPDILLLEIISLLDVEEICRFASVCSHFHKLTADAVLWRKRLQNDSKKWAVIGHSTNPDTYRAIDMDCTEQRLYLRCCPKVKTAMLRSNHSFHQLSALLRSMLPQKTPKIAMFGPGLESSATSGLARKIYEPCHKFVVKSAFPGQFAGHGSGFSILTPGGLAFRLITLYSSTKRERLSGTNLHRLQNSRLLMQAPGVDKGNYVLRPPIHDLCSTLDACIFVVNASEKNNGDELRAELLALLSATECQVPLVILACTKSDTTHKMASIDVTRMLQLAKLSKPWQVHSCVVDSMSGVANAISWLIEQTRRLG